MTFDILEPDFAPLRRSFLALAEQRGEVSLEDLADFALRETIYKRTHARPVVEELVDTRQLDPVRTGRSYADKIYRLASPALF